VVALQVGWGGEAACSQYELVDGNPIPAGTLEAQCSLSCSGGRIHVGEMQGFDLVEAHVEHRVFPVLNLITKLVKSQQGKLQLKNASAHFEV